MFPPCFRPGAVDTNGTVNEAAFIKAMRTNKGDDADASTFVAFSNDINAANDDYKLSKVVKKWTSAKRWAAQLAVDRLVNHWDGPTNFRAPEALSPLTNGADMNVMDLFGSRDDSSAAGAAGAAGAVSAFCEAEDGCGAAGPCFMENLGCNDGNLRSDGVFAGCAEALPCAACYPDSSCSSRRERRGATNTHAAINPPLAARSRRASDAGFWTHNFFIYEEDRKNQSKREFDLIPWDVDGKCVVSVCPSLPRSLSLSLFHPAPKRNTPM